MNYKNIYVEIMDGSDLTYYHRTDLFKKGFRFRKKDKVWFQTMSNQNSIDNIKHYCHDNGLICFVYSKNHLRDNHYRDNYFKKNSPLFNKYYICAYCFKIVPKEKITVDHIISVKKAKSNTYYQGLMNRLKITNVNDEKNLVACCQNCNSKKGKKGGLWVIRGFLGKHTLWIMLCYSMMFIVIINFIWLLLNFR